MDLKWIIKRLKVSGQNTKEEVINALENATVNELVELRRSITEKINKISEKKDDKN